MFYPVKLLDPRGIVKQVISSDELSKKYWSSFQDFNVEKKEGVSGYKFSSKKKKKKWFHEAMEFTLNG